MSKAMATAAPALTVKKRSSRAAMAVSGSESSDSIASHPTTVPSSPASADSEHRSFSIRSFKHRPWHSFASKDRDGTPDGGHSFRTRARRLSKSRPLSSSSHLEPPSRRGSTVSDDFARLSLSTTDSLSLSFVNASLTALPVDWAAQHVEGSAPLEHDALLLKNKAPYLVVTSEYLVKTKSRSDAVALLPGLSTEEQKRGHGGSPPEPLLVIPVDAIMSVFVAETTRPSFGIEVWWRNRPAGHSSCRSEFFFATPAQRNEMMLHITRAMRTSQQNEDHHARCSPDVRALLEKLHETEEPRFQHRKPDIIPVVPRGFTRKEYIPKLEDASKKPQEAPAFYLVVGTYFCHLVEILKSKTGDPVCRHKSFGLVTLECLRGDWVVHEERFNITFRDPFQPPVILELASRYYREVIRVLGTADRFLKPAWPQLWQTMEVFRVSGLKEQQYLVPKEDFGSFKRTLDAYLAAYHCEDVNWEINWKTRFAPEFRLLPGKRGPYNPLQLLAVLRALRYNDYFTSLSFRDVDLTVLHGLEDNSFSKANVAYLSRTCVALGPDEIGILKVSPVLHQEFHALAFCSETIRQMDLGNCSKSFHVQMTQRGNQVPSLQFLTPILRLLRSGITKCNRLIVSGNTLPQFDVDDLAETMKCGAIQALDVSYCGLDDASLREMIVEPLSDYPGLLQSLSVSGNPGRLPAHILPGLFRYLKDIRELNLSGSIQAESNIEGSLLPFAALESMENLEELNVSGYKLDAATFQDLEKFLEYRSWKIDQGKPLRFHKLVLNHCGITGSQAARLFRAIGENRGMHLSLNGNPIEYGIEDITAALSANQGPTGLYMEMIEFKEEAHYLDLLKAFTVTRHLTLLSLAGTAPSPSSPGPCSDELVATLHDLLAHNTSIQFLDLSGFSGKLDDGQLPLGAGRALAGLAANTTLTHLRIRNQNLHDEAGLLGRALAENTTLRALDCRGNNFNLTSLRFLVDSIAGADRSALVEFPLPAEERAAIWRNVLRGLQRTPSNLPPPAVGTASATGTANAGSNAIRDLLREEEALLRDVLEGLFATLEKKLKENRARLLGDAVRLGRDNHRGDGGGDDADRQQREYSYRHRHRHRHQRSGSSGAAGLLAMDGGDDAWPSVGEISGIGVDLGFDPGMGLDMSPSAGSGPGSGHGGNGEAGPLLPQIVAPSEEADGETPLAVLHEYQQNGDTTAAAAAATTNYHTSCVVGGDGMDSPAETLDPSSEAETPPEGQEPSGQNSVQVIVGEAEPGRLSGDGDGGDVEGGDELFRKMVDDFRRAGFDV